MGNPDDTRSADETYWLNCKRSHDDVTKLKLFALLASCEGNPTVTGGFLLQRLVTQSFDVLFDLRLKKQLRSSANNRNVSDLRRHRAHYDVTVMIIVTVLVMVTKPTRPPFWATAVPPFMAHDQVSLSIRDCFNSLFPFQNHHVYHTCIYKWKRSLQTVLYWNPILSIMFPVGMSYTIFYFHIHIAIGMQWLVKDE